MTFNPGDKIFAKVKGYPHWPCRINPLPEDVNIPKGKYPIFFYGTHEVYFLPKKDIFEYNKNLEKYSKKSNKAAFLDGMKEIEENPDVLLYGKDPEAEEFLLQFYDFETSTEQKTPEKKSPNVARRRKMKPSEIASNKENESEKIVEKPEEPKKLNALGRPVRKSASNFSAKKMILGNDYLSEESELSSVTTEGNKEDLEKLLLPDQEQKTPEPAEETNNEPIKNGEKESKPSAADDDFIYDGEFTEKSEQKTSKKKSPPKSKKKDLAKAVKEAKAQNRKRNTSFSNNKEVKSPVPSPQPQIQKRNDIPIEEECKDLEKETKLMMLDRGIKSCLVLNQENFSTCLNYMKQLEGLQVSLISLAKCYSIVLTIKKCRRYTRSSEIKLIAQQIFNNFLEIFTTSSKNQITDADKELKKRTEPLIQSGKTKDIPRSIAELFSFQKISNVVKTAPPTQKVPEASPREDLETKPSTEEAKKVEDKPATEAKPEKKIEPTKPSNLMEQIKKAFIRQVQTKSPSAFEEVKSPGSKEVEQKVSVPPSPAKVVEPAEVQTSINTLEESTESIETEKRTDEKMDTSEPVEYHRPPSPLDEELLPKSPKTPSFEDCINPEPKSASPKKSNVAVSDPIPDRKRDRSPHALPHPLKHYKRCFLQALGVEEEEKEPVESKVVKKKSPRKEQFPPASLSPKREIPEEDETRLGQGRAMSSTSNSDHLDLDSRIADLFHTESKPNLPQSPSTTGTSSPIPTTTPLLNIPDVPEGAPPPPPPLQNSNLLLKARPPCRPMQYPNNNNNNISNGYNRNTPVSPLRNGTAHLPNFILQQQLMEKAATPASPPSHRGGGGDILDLLQKRQPMTGDVSKENDEVPSNLVSSLTSAEQPPVDPKPSEPPITRPEQAELRDLGTNQGEENVPQDERGVSPFVQPLTEEKDKIKELSNLPKEETFITENVEEKNGEAVES